MNSSPGSSSKRDERPRNKKGHRERAKRFDTQRLDAAAVGLLEALGYRSEKRIVVEPNAPENFLATCAPDKSLNREHALFDDWLSADFLFQLTDDEVRAAAAGPQPFLFDSKGKWNGAEIHSFLFLAIALKKDRYTRTELSGITRAVNRLFLMPAIILFRHGDTLTLAIINRRSHKLHQSKDVLEKVTLIKDVRIANPHRAHIEILFDLSFDALLAKHEVSNFVQLQTAWQKTLDSSELNKRFYEELANWYFWALDNVRFPDGAPKDREGRDSLSLIRLITRLVFCWFLREKGLIPDELFQRNRLERQLDFSDAKKSTYYKAVLQNLFFATLNTEMDTPGQPPSRKFSSQSQQTHMVHSLYRYENLISDRSAFLKLFGSIPFLNGGLFECLDERDETGETRVDGFSDHSSNRLSVPDFLFFGKEQPVNLSGAYGEARYSQVKVRPLIPILERYKFTVAENTPIEEEVALDPELLGHVFENLLAAYNPETDSAARKTTGAFYTPRIVVDFMVDEALLLYLQPVLESTAPKPQSPFAPRLRQLLSYTGAQPDFSPAELRVLVDAIDQVKILDPACGSGAYPMGALHKLVFLLGKLDPGNAAWKERQLAKARELDVARDAAEQAVEDAFARDHGDYARKLYLIENCLYGVDIQPIAVQIAKLRCFISLIVEQEPADKLPNRGILPLPNLETKFIAANTLLGLHRIGEMDLVMRDIEEKKAELRRVRHEHFLARRYNQKKELRKRDRQLRGELAKLLKSSHLFPAKEAEMLADWDPYHADRGATFFDIEWMFGLDPARRRSPATLRGNLALVNATAGQSELVPAQPGSSGFDILIGNPPYVRQEQIKDLKPLLMDDYFCYTGVADLFVYFYEKSFDLLRVGGILSFISSNKYFRSGYGERLRHFLASNGEVRVLIDFGDAPVFTAIAYPSILLARKIRETRDKGQLPPFPKGPEQKSGAPSNSIRALTWESVLKDNDTPPVIQDFPSILTNRGFDLPQHALRCDGWRLESRSVLALLEKLRSAGKPLGEYVKGRFYRGILTGLNEAFVVDRNTRDRLIAEHKSSAEVLKPFLRGRDVKRWRTEPQDLWLIFTRRGIDISKFPAIHDHLFPLKRSLTAGAPGGRKHGSYQWYEIQDNVAYWQEFELPKILYPDIYEHQSFAWDEANYFAANTCYFIPTKEKWLTGLLNSKSVEYFYSCVSNNLRGGYFRAFSDYMRQIPIPAASLDQQKDITKLVGNITTAKASKNAAIDISRLEKEIDALVYGLYGPTPEEIKIVEEAMGG